MSRNERLLYWVKREVRRNNLTRFFGLILRINPRIRIRTKNKQKIIMIRKVKRGNDVPTFSCTLGDFWSSVTRHPTVVNRVKSVGDKHLQFHDITVSFCTEVGHYDTHEKFHPGVRGTRSQGPLLLSTVFCILRDDGLWTHLRIRTKCFEK